MMPDGISLSTVFLPPMISVCPALWPPWKRTTPCAYSVSQSTTLPLPSSPHCVPMTTTLLFIAKPRSDGNDFPRCATAGKLPVAVRSRRSAVRLGAAQGDDDDLASRAQRRDRLDQRRIVAVGGRDAAARRGGRDERRELPRIETETRRGTGTSERGADVVVASAAPDRPRLAARVDGKHHAVVVVEVAELREIGLHRCAGRGERIGKH